MAPHDEREKMVRRHLVHRGIDDPRILDAFRAVPRERFLPDALQHVAYDDSPLPIGGGQTISQPYIVALTAHALLLDGTERVLEIGTGSGYAAAILGRIAHEVFTIERIEELATSARQRLAELGCMNVHVHHGDGSLGLPGHAPYDAIAVAAGGPEVPNALREQLAIGGRLVMPIGPSDDQVLMRIVREGENDYLEERLAEVRFVPLIGEQAWPETKPPAAAKTPRDDTAISMLLRETAEPIRDLGDECVEPLLDHVGDARLVLLGEATHGTSEFYRLRARISMELIERYGFDFVAVEADWPDAARIDNFVLGDPPRSRPEFVPFSRFPTWMWRNEEVSEFVAWLRRHNLEKRDREERAGFHGLDLYSMFTSIAAVLLYLDEVDPAAAAVARSRYGLLTPWQKDPTAYGEAVLVGKYESSEEAVVGMLRDLLTRRLEYATNDGERFFDAVQNARVVANAERYYRAMYYGSVTSWNLRDSHMFATLEALLRFYGTDSKGIVWEHNSHLGDARATELGERGEHNVGQLCREKFGNRAFLVGFGTDHGTVAAASAWDGPMRRMDVSPALAESYERLFHEAGVPAFFTHLREPRRCEVRDELLASRLERAIGVVYRPETERTSHYFEASLPEQFDEYVWFDATTAVTPLAVPAGPRELDLSDTFPFGT